MARPRRAETLLPRWSTMLRALREASGVTQGGWAAHLGYSRASVQRWERGESAPDAAAEQALLALCREKGLLRAYQNGPLAGVAVTDHLLRELLAEARAGVTPNGGDALAPDGARRPVAAPPSLPDPTRTNLPAPPTSFVGREEDQATVRRLLERSRLVTLTGTGGVGKTRLAVETAAGLVDRYPGGVWLVELAPLADPALIAQATAQALGVREAPNTPILESVVAALQEQPRLLMLDNCEHLRAEVAAFAETLLRRCPAVHILATSRAALGVIGETVWWVPSLPIPEATAADGLPHHTAAGVLRAAAGRLFCDRAEAAHPAFILTDGHAPAVAAICRRLDGVPLAVELAAARARILTPAQIAAHLDERFRLLAGGSPDAPTRQQTLRAALDWSHDLLSEPEQALLARLSVFAGGCELAAVEAVCVDELVTRDALFELLGGLVTQSLVVVEHGGEAARYHMLESVREYAAERLAASGEADAVLARRADWILALVLQAAEAEHGPDQATWHDRIETELDTLRAVLHWTLDRGQAARGLEIAARLYLFWERRGHLDEGRRWIGRLLPLAQASSARDRALASYVDGSLARRQGDFAAAVASLEAALAVFRELDDRSAVSDACYILGDIAMARRDVAAAQDHFEECLTIARALDDPGMIGIALDSLGIVARWRRRLDEARAYNKESLALHRAHGSLSNVAIGANNLAMIESLAGNLPAARAGLEEAVALARRLGNSVHLAFFLAALAGVARRQGDRASAQRHADEALRLAQEGGSRPAASQAYATLAAVARERGDLAAARRLARANLELVHDLDDVRCTLPALWEAAACVAADQPETAARLFGAAATLRDATEYPLPEQVERELRDRVAMVSASMGETAFAATWAEGAAMTPGQAVAHALAAGAPDGDQLGCAVSRPSRRDTAPRR